MANVLTNLAADIYKAADVVGRELVGAIPSATINATTDQAAVGQTVRSHFTRAATAVTLTPSMTIPEGTDQTVDNKTMTLTKQRGVQIPWTGEDVKFVNGGPGYETVLGDQIAQAMRVLANEAETDLCTAIYQGHHAHMVQQEPRHLAQISTKSLSYVGFWLITECQLMANLL